jgi:DNA-binding transcriptional MocR family regulator
VSSLPIADLQGAWQRALARLREHGNHFDPLGWPPLRAAIARALAGRGIAKHADGVLVDADADEQGLRVDELARVARSRRVKLAYVTPSVQLPTGAQLSAERREALLALADRIQMPVVEDDYECELRGAAPSVAALAARAGGDRVVYVGTFSKALFPGLRIGYVVAAPALLRALALVRFAAGLQPSLVDQMALAELLARDTIERHVRRVRKRLTERSRVMAAALRAHWPEGTRFREPGGGSAIWIELPPGVDPDALAVAASRAGIAYGAGDAYRIDRDGPPALLLSLVAAPADAIERAVAELGALVHAELFRRPVRARRPRA